MLLNIERLQLGSRPSARRARSTKLDGCIPDKPLVAFGYEDVGFGLDKARGEPLNRELGQHVSSNFAVDAMGAVSVQPDLDRQDSEAVGIAQLHGANLETLTHDLEVRGSRSEAEGTTSAACGCPSRL